MPLSKPHLSSDWPIAGVGIGQSFRYESGKAGQRVRLSTNFNFLLRNEVVVEVKFE